jgi:hypothetical protein
MAGANPFPSVIPLLSSWEAYINANPQGNLQGFAHWLLTHPDTSDPDLSIPTLAAYAGTHPLSTDQPIDRPSFPVVNTPLPADRPANPLPPEGSPATPATTARTPALDARQPLHPCPHPHPCARRNRPQFPSDRPPAPDARPPFQTRR